MGSTSLDGKVAVVTGAAAGLGRAEALALAGAGAAVVVNDVSPRAAAVVDEIEQLGGKAVLVAGDVAEGGTADALVGAALGQFGGLHILVNNAGVLRDRMLFNMSDEEWDTVIRVHLRGHFLLSRNAAAYWRTESKRLGESVYGRIVNTSSEAGLVGSEGQPNYAAAKSGITALTVATARALARYGVRANAICPRARTAMTTAVFGEAPAGASDPLDPSHVATLVAYLASPAAGAVNGQVFVAYGGMVALMAPPTVERRFDADNGVWTADELAATVGDYFSERDSRKTFSCAEVLTIAVDA